MERNTTRWKDFIAAALQSKGQMNNGRRVSDATAANSRLSPLQLARYTAGKVEERNDGSIDGLPGLKMADQGQ
jgi:hypothetical protein